MSGSSRRRGAVPVEWLAVAAVLAIPAAGAVDALAGAPLLQPLAAFLALTLVPGALLLTLFGLPPRRSLPWLLYAVGVSLVTVMAVGLVTNLFYPAVGVSEPLSPLPLLGTLGAVVAALALLVARTDPPGRRLDVGKALSGLSRTPAAPMAILLLPVAGVLGVSYLNRTGDNRLLLVALVAVSLVAVLVALGRLATRWHGLALWAAGATLLYHKSLWRFYDFSGQGNVVAAWIRGRWSPALDVPGAASSSLLPNVVLYPTYAHLGGVDIFTELHVLNPLLVSLIPVASFVVFRRYVPSRDAFLGAALVAFAHPFYFQFPTAGRAASPALFLALFVLAVTDDDLPAVGATSLGLAFAAGLVVSHYGASYFVLFAFAGALVLLAAHRAIEERTDGVPAVPVPGGDGRGAPGGRSEGEGRRARDDRGEGTGRTARSDRGGVDRYRARADSDEGDGRGLVDWLTPTFVGFYAVLTLAWYMYTFGGRKFSVLVTHVASTVDQLYRPSGGGTTARLATDYGAVSIQLSKVLYLGFAGLTAVGLAAVYLDRFRGRPQPFDDQFLALATMLVGAYGLSFFFSSAWGGGRPLILTFVVGGVFAVVGARRLAGAVAARAPDRGAVAAGRIGALARPGVSLMLVALLLSNTGVGAATVLGGYAPSNVPLQDRIEQADGPQVRQIAYDDADLRANVWLVRHYDPDREVFADFVARAKNNDWNRPQLVAATDARPGLLVIGFASQAQLENPRVIPSYVWLAGHNVRMDAFVLNNRETLSMELLRPELDERDRVYQSPYGAVYYENVTR